MAKPKALINSTFEVSTGELATVVGKSGQWIRQLTREGVLKQSAMGKYNLSAAVQAYIEHAQGGKEEDNKPRFIDHKTEHERIKAELAALELAERRGELHNAAEIEAALTDMLTAFRQKMLGLPTKIAPQLASVNDPNQIKRLLTKEVYETLTELSEYDPEMFQNENAREGTDADT